MTYAAFGIHRQLIEDEGFDPSSDEYYSELDKRVRTEFPHKFAEDETRHWTQSRFCWVHGVKVVVKGAQNSQTDSIADCDCEAIECSARGICQVREGVSYGE